MRIKLNNPKLFVDEILSLQNLSLKEFSKRMRINYSSLKQTRRGERTFTEEIFNIFINLSPRKEYWNNNKEELDDNWGGVKGGNISAKMLDKYNRAEYARRFRKLVNVNIILNEFFCEFYGALLGDGCISRFEDYEHKKRIVIAFSGNKRLDSEYFKYLASKLKEEYGLGVYFYEVKNKNVCTLVIKNKNFSLNLHNNFGVAIGLKYNSLHISNKVLNLPWNIKKFVLRGLFDTDGCTLANKREKYRYPWVTISSKSEYFRNQIIKMLREQGYPAYNTGSDVCVRGIANVKRWFSDIGSSNSRNILKYEYFLKHGCLPARLL
ncbi:MAG: LAGLIDADG family homing endonuclease [Nanoarchaeota archaeon]